MADKKNHLVPALEGVKEALERSDDRNDKLTLHNVERAIYFQKCKDDPDTPVPPQEKG